MRGCLYQLRAKTRTRRDIRARSESVVRFACPEFFLSLFVFVFVVLFLSPGPLFNFFSSFFHFSPYPGRDSGDKWVYFDEERFRRLERRSFTPALTYNEFNFRGDIRVYGRAARKRKHGSLIYELAGSNLTSSAGDLARR